VVCDHAGETLLALLISFLLALLTAFLLALLSADGKVVALLTALLMAGDYEEPAASADDARPQRDR